MAKTKKKLLSIYDLEDFYLNHKNSVKFSSEKSGYQLAVQVPMQFDTTDVSEDGTLHFYNVRAFHIGRNRNHSSVTEDAATKAMKSMAYKPILANFCEYEKDGEVIRDFTSHDMVVDVENDNVQYIEHQIGCFTSDEPYFEEDNGKKYICARIAIPNEYTDANDIIERKSGTKMSVEILVNELSYNSADKVLELTDIDVQGLTCLGTKIDADGNPHEVEEGMEGSGISLKDFSKSNNSLFSEVSENSKLIDTLEKLNSTLENFNIYSTGKEEIQVENEEIEVVEEVTEEETTEEVTEESTEEVTTETEEEVSEETVEDSPADEEVTEDEETEKEDFSLEPMTRTYEISHEDTRYALYNLIAQYEEMDNDWYDILKVYDDKFIMQGWMSGNLYGQKYSVDGDNVALDGERYVMYAEFITESEKAELDSMRANYSAIKEKADKYDYSLLEAERVAEFEKEDYSSIKDKPEFVELAKEENHKDFSLEEVQDKLNDIILSYAKAGQLNFAATEQPKSKVSVTRLPIDTKSQKKSRYGSLFNKEN